MRLIVNAETLTIDDLIALEEGNAKSIRGIRDLLARFAVDDNGQPMPLDEAIVALGKFSVSDLMGAVDQLKAAVSRIKETAVPPAISSS
jgi:hypothetical protein